MWSHHRANDLFQKLIIYGRFFTKPIRIQPLGVRVFVELDKSKSEKLEANLFHKEQVNHGKVVDVVPGSIVDGKRLQMTLQFEDQKVLLPTFGGQVVKNENQEDCIQLLMKKIFFQYSFKHM